MRANQWRSHWGGKGGRVPPLTAKKMPKIGKNWGKSAKIGKKRQKAGNFFHFALLTDRAGCATGANEGWSDMGAHNEWHAEGLTPGGGHSHMKVTYECHQAPQM